MPQHDSGAGTQAVSTTPHYSGDNSDLDVPDIRCDICDKVFTRTEHLRRHKRAHSAEKPFACVECDKRFARRDILKRHQAGHVSRRQESADGSSRYARACFACAGARVKCLRGKVCQRCRSRDLQCRYPSRRSQSPFSPSEEDGLGDERMTDRDGMGDERMTERDAEDSCIITWSNEIESNNNIPTLLAKETSWPNHLLAATTPSASAPNGQLWNVSSSEATLAAVGVAQTPSATGSPMSARDQLISKSFLNAEKTIIPGAQLLPQVGKGNIGSLYNYSRINWLAPTDQPQINQTFPVASPGSTASSNIHSGDGFTNGFQVQNTQVLPHLSPGSHFEEPHLELYVDSRTVGLNRQHSYQVASVSSPTAQPEAPMYYIDGDGARLSIPARTQQNRQSIPLFSVLNNSLSPSSPEGFESIHSHSASGYSHRQCWFTEESYAALTEYLERAQQRDISMAHRNTLPSLKDLNDFVRLYFDKFHHTFPLLYKASFLSNRDGCLLELAMAAIGACYASTFYARKCSESLHELVHTLLETATTSDYNPSDFPAVFGLRRLGYPQPITRLQTRILNVLGMFHSGNLKLASFAREDRAVLVTICMESKILMPNHYDGWQTACSTDEEGDQFLQQWLEGELRCRAGYFVWMLDCMMAYESNFRTHMYLLDAKAPLPCPEQIWDAAVLDKAQIPILNNGPPSLCHALDLLYTEKKLAPNLGELSRVLIIHGMYRRVWEAARYHSDSLSGWVPTALSEPPHRVTSEKSTMPPSRPVVSRWINASCDCLDILHWSALSTILQASGLEHPTILHLHLARLILLAPVSELQDLANAKLRQQTRSLSESYLDATIQEQDIRNALLKWVVHDQFKARLAIIHAGSIFWYLRRYSCGAVIEPFANYLATLVIWAYSISTSAVQLLSNSSPHDSQPGTNNNIQTPRASHQTHNGDMNSQHSPSGNHNIPNSNYYNPSPHHSQLLIGLEMLECYETSIIQLDRPCDDELVQLFVRLGEKMTPYMARVGDIRCVGAGGKVLREGVKLLSYGADNADVAGGGEGGGRFIWGAGERFVELLEALGGG